MTAFTFTSPAGLWALAALAAVAVFYLFYRRYRPRRVTGLFLWGVPQRGNLGGRKAEIPLPSRAFLFDILAALFLALSLAGPAWRGSGGLPLAIVLDASFAMQARDRHHDVRKAAAALAKNATGPTRGIFVALAGETPALLYGPGPAAGAAAAIGGYDPTASSSDLQAAVDLVRDAYGLGLDIHVFTNREATLLAGTDSLLTTHVYAARGGNLAFRQVWREPDAETDAPGETVTVALVNHAGAATQAGLRLDTAAGELLTVAEVSLPPWGKVVTHHSVSGVADKTVKITLAAEGRDVIAADSVAFLPPAPKKTITYGLSDLPPAAARFAVVALEAAGATPWTPADPPRDDDGPDLLITADPESAGRAATLEIPQAGQPVVHAPPLIMDTANRLCRDVRLGDLPWVARGRAAPAHDITEVIIASGGQPLYWRSADGRLHLDAVLDASPLVFSAAWPVLIANLVSEAASALPGLSESAYGPGQSLAYRADPFAPDRPSYRLLSRDPGGLAIPVDPEAGGAVPRRAGWYELQTADGQPVAEIAVLPLYGAASDVRHASDRDIVFAPANDAAAATGLIDLRWLFVLIGLCFLALNWRRTMAGERQ